MTTEQQILISAYAQKMLDKKLDFLPLIDSYELLQAGIKLETMFSWVMHSEELTDNGYGKSLQELLLEYDEIYGEGNQDYLKVGKKYDEFDEFTLEICPAPTYIDLIINN